VNDLKALMLGPPRLRLALAESLTCGRLQARVGAIPGASDFFLGGITAYTIEQKARHLGVDPGEARSCNAVSAAVAEQMARGACLLFGADVGAATTGYAEPAADKGALAPFAWWALARRAGGGFGVRSGRVDCPGLPRTEVQERVALAAYVALVAWLRETAAGRTP
jgi:nicotinamide-nucleotide amidase